ncbi:hypothetical protein RMN56_20690 [Micromonospora halotolerans]|uniref:Uncharacterized protein n=1 Tax=Micromonospora halotolerans TaxID=709879 RepID=A0ABY9ZQR9_9ACTN|nr:hypothetical protein [Micromonospora halotolerans]WNM37574.1 hypothetical protein RMN56_20690 [Micromonospora halotolerans]
MSRRQAAREMQEAVEREILKLLAEHGEMTTWQVQAEVKTGRTRIVFQDEWGELEHYDSWSLSYIRNRLYELCHDRVTWRKASWGPGWDGRPAGVSQYLWRLQTPEGREQMRLAWQREKQALDERLALIRRDGIGDAPSKSD